MLPCSNVQVLCALIAVSLPALFLRSPTAPYVYHSRPSYEFSTSENCGDVCSEPGNDSDNTYMIRLSKPWHHFDSNHWFHVSEYYLSRHQSVHLSQVPNDANLVIVSDDPGFASNITEMTLFIMMMSFTQGNPRNVYVIDYAALVAVKAAPTDRNMHIFEYSGPVYHYKRDLPYFERYKLLPGIYSSKNTFSLNKTQSNISSPPPSNSSPRGGLNRCTCGHFVTELGAAPIDRGYWFGGVEDVQRQRDKISSLCPSDDVLYQESTHNLVAPFLWAAPTNISKHGSDEIVVKHIHRKDKRSKSKKNGKYFKNILLRGPDRNSSSLYHPRNGTSMLHNSTKRGFKMVVYQRNEDRKFLYFEYMLKTIKSNLPLWTIEVMFHEENLEPCMLKASLQDADIFLTTHGFQSMAILFMKKGSLIMELFPYKYWKVGYKPLAEEYGVHHRWMQSQGPVSYSHYLLYLFSQRQCMLSHWCRDFSRNEDIIMTPPMLKSFLELAKEIESNKIGSHNAPAIFGVKNLLTA